MASKIEVAAAKRLGLSVKELAATPGKPIGKPAKAAEKPAKPTKPEKPRIVVALEDIGYKFKGPYSDGTEWDAVTKSAKSKPLELVKKARLLGYLPFGKRFQSSLKRHSFYHCLAWFKSLWGNKYSYWY